MGCRSRRSPHIVRASADRRRSPPKRAAKAAAATSVAIAARRRLAFSVIQAMPGTASAKRANGPFVWKPRKIARPARSAFAPKRSGRVTLRHANQTDRRAKTTNVVSRRFDCVL